ncbi:MAG: replication initiator protein A, partial [Candidatus Omnitrophota bacterium]
MEQNDKPLALTRASLNVEKMPIVFLGTPEERKRIQMEVAKTGKPILIYHVIEDGVEKKLSLSPSSVLGLLTAFDMDVLTVIHHKLFEAKKTVGYCPTQMRLWISEFPKIMKLTTNGGLYDRIIESIKRLSTTDIYHENFVKISETDTKTMGSYREKALKIVIFKGSGKEITKSNGTERMSKVFVDIEIPEWHSNNINSGYTTEFDTNIYFKITND